MMHRDVIVGITVSRGSFVFSQSRVKVSASLARCRKPGSQSILSCLFKLVSNCPSAESKGGAPPHLILGKKGTNDRREKSQQDNKLHTAFPPFHPPLAQGLDAPLCRT